MSFEQLLPRLGYSVLTFALLAGCAPATALPAQDPVQESGVTQPATSEAKAGGDVAPADLMAMEGRMGSMRGSMAAMGDKPAAEDMRPMMDGMQLMMGDMQSMMQRPEGQTASADMGRMQGMMGQMESMGMSMQDMMSGMGMMSGAEGPAMSQMMERMKTMHADLDQRMPSDDPHHPTPTS